MSKRVNVAGIMVVGLMLTGIQAHAGVPPFQSPATTSVESKTVSTPSSAASGPSADGAGMPSSSTSNSHRTSFSKKLASISSGIIVGTAVNMVRKPIDEEKLAIEDLGGQKKQNPRFSKPFGVFWSPFAAAAGIIEAPFYALDNSLVHSDKSFSRKQFSLIEKSPPPPTVDPIHPKEER